MAAACRISRKHRDVSDAFVFALRGSIENPLSRDKKLARVGERRETRMRSPESSTNNSTLALMMSSDFHVMTVHPSSEMSYFFVIKRKCSESVSQLRVERNNAPEPFVCTPRVASKVGRAREGNAVPAHCLHYYRYRTTRAPNEKKLRSVYDDDGRVLIPNRIHHLKCFPSAGLEPTTSTLGLRSVKTKESNLKQRNPPWHVAPSFSLTS
ncbi:hypothetical protein EVAR_754_1 [Eumeta japonica]|uniref:Uncharacterized protein n=1 Tax=Eumeta variegata TaxID=151549 RepID=A0A4C1SCQ1_EUMVA|nr:hypothetical protein EVAR_754_1 [Eumeta japonica]